MKKTTIPARLVVVRTPAINDLLQQAWALSPELTEKISLTVYQAIVALVRERRRYQAFASEYFSPAPANMAEVVMGEAVKGLEDSITEDSGTALSEPHPDSIWND